MTVYLVLFLFLLLLAVATWWFEFDPLFFVGCAAWILLVGLRSPVVGTDTKAYVDYFLKPGAGYGGELRALEPGYVLWNSLLNFTGLGDLFFLMMTGIASLVGGFFFVWRNSRYKAMSLALFAIVPEILRQPLGTLRQAMAISIFLVGFHLFQRKDIASRLQGAALFALAASFHRSIVVVAGVTFFATLLPLSTLVLRIGIVATALMGLTDRFDLRSLFGKVSGSLGFLGLDRLSSYSEFRADDWNVGTKARIFMMFPGILMAGACLWGFRGKDRPPLLVQVSVLGMILYDLTLSYPMAGRATVAYFMLMVVALTNQLGKSNLRALAIYAILVAFYLRLSIFAFKLDIDGATEILIAPYKPNPGMWN